jgi:DNA processing protein
MHGSVEAKFHIGIVGTRRPEPIAAAFTKNLAAAVCAAGGCVVSGGAYGIDRAAHEGALDAGGHTVAVLGTGSHVPYPADHRELFESIAERGGGLLWRVDHDVGVFPGCFNQRNAVLAALCDALVVVQAPNRSGALNAARFAQRMGRTLWAVALSPWEASCVAEQRRDDGTSCSVFERFAGSLGLIAEGSAHALFTCDALLESIRPGSQVVLPLAASEPPELPLLELNNQEKALLAVVDGTPRHLDDLAGRAGLSPQAVQTALLTLALENVVVEGPGGFYRRSSP